MAKTKLQLLLDDAEFFLETLEKRLRNYSNKEEFSKDYLLGREAECRFWRNQLRNLVNLERKGEL